MTLRGRWVKFDYPYPQIGDDDNEREAWGKVIRHVSPLVVIKAKEPIHPSATWAPPTRLFLRHENDVHR